MDKQLMMFEGRHEIIVLFAEDVNFKFEGDFIISAKDVAVVLEYQGESATNHVLKFCKEKHVYHVSNSNILNRSVRRLHNTGEKFISNFALNRALGQSGQPKADVFQDWIYEDMIPTVQKTGGYVANDDLFVNTYLTHADEQTKLIFRATLETVRTQNQKITVMAPKADYFDALVDRNLLTSFRTTAQELHVFEGKFIEWLIDENYIYRDRKQELKAYAPYVPSLFDYKEWDNRQKAGVQTMITPKGRETFRLLVPAEIKKK